MRSQILINTIGCHAAGEVGEVILSGVQSPIGKTIADKSKFLMNHPALRNLLLLEPRGGVYKHFNLILLQKLFIYTVRKVCEDWGGANVNTNLQVDE